MWRLGSLPLRLPPGWGWVPLPRLQQIFLTEWSLQQEGWLLPGPWTEENVRGKAQLSSVVLRNSALAQNFPILLNQTKAAGRHHPLPVFIQASLRLLLPSPNFPVSQGTLWGSNVIISSESWYYNELKLAGGSPHKTKLWARNPSCTSSALGNVMTRLSLAVSSGTWEWW